MYAVVDTKTNKIIGYCQFYSVRGEELVLQQVSLSHYYTYLYPEKKEYNDELVFPKNYHLNFQAIS